MIEIPVRNHHAEWLKDNDPEENYETMASFIYKVGTPRERRAYRDANLRAKRAIEEGNYQNIGESGPDEICDACLDWSCPNSGVVRFDRQVRERETAYYQMENDPRISILFRAVNKTITFRELNSAIEGIIDEYYLSI
jgi:hypothetical protein